MELNPAQRAEALGAVAAAAAGEHRDDPEIWVDRELQSQDMLPRKLKRCRGKDQVQNRPPLGIATNRRQA
jgi:hypothetical protein